MFCALFIAVMLPMFACSDEELVTVSRCYPADACGGVQYGAQPLVFTAIGGDVQRGQEIYQSQCASCHGAGGQGNGQLGQGNFADPLWQTRFTDNQIRLTVRQGRGMAMPAMPMPDNAMKDLVAYLRTLAPRTN